MWHENKECIQNIKAEKMYVREKRLVRDTPLSACAGRLDPSKQTQPKSRMQAAGGWRRGRRVEDTTHFVAKCSHVPFRNFHKGQGQRLCNNFKDISQMFI